SSRSRSRDRATSSWIGSMRDAQIDELAAEAHLAVRAVHLLPGIMLLLAGGCGNPTSPPPKPDPAAAALQADPDTAQAIQSSLSQVINEATIHYLPLEYQYDEDLLEKLDRIEAQLSGKDTAPTPRFLPKLDEAEERDHFRETVRRWEAATGKK